MQTPCDVAVLRTETMRMSQETKVNKRQYWAAEARLREAKNASEYDQYPVEDEDSARFSSDDEYDYTHRVVKATTNHCEEKLYRRVKREYDFWVRCLNLIRMIEEAEL